MDLLLPLVAVSKQLLLVIKQLLTGLGRVFDVGCLNNGVDRARFLAETAVNALSHVDIVTSCPARSVNAFFCFDGDGERWADGLAELARNAAFFTRRVSAKSMLSPETWRYGTFLEGIVDGVGRTIILLQNDVHTAEKFSHEEEAAGTVERGFTLVPLLCGLETVFWWVCCWSRLCGSRGGEGEHADGRGSGGRERSGSGPHWAAKETEHCWKNN